MSEKLHLMAQILDQDPGRIRQEIQEHPDSLLWICSMDDWSRSRNHDLQIQLPQIEGLPRMFHQGLVPDPPLSMDQRGLVVRQSILNFPLLDLVIDPHPLDRRRRDMDETAHIVTKRQLRPVHPTQRESIHLVLTKLMQRHQRAVE